MLILRVRVLGNVPVVGGTAAASERKDREARESGKMGRPAKPDRKSPKVRWNEAKLWVSALTSLMRIML